MKYFYKNGEFAGTGCNDCTVAICEGDAAVSFTKEWRTVGKKLEFMSYGIDKQERLFQNALKSVDGISDAEKEIFLRVLSAVAKERKVSLNARNVTGCE